MTTGSADETGRGEPIAALVHELNNVLSAVLGYAEIVHADAGSGRVEERDALQILAATRRAIELADEIGAAIRAGADEPSPAAAARSEPGGPA